MAVRPPTFTPPPPYAAAAAAAGPVIAPAGVHDDDYRHFHDTHANVHANVHANTHVHAEALLQSPVAAGSIEQEFERVQTVPQPPPPQSPIQVQTVAVTAVTVVGAAQPPPLSSISASAPSSAPAARGSFCSSCGTHLDPQHKFCGKVSYT